MTDKRGSEGVIITADNEESEKDMESEIDEQKGKPKRKSRLSLNSEVKEKPREDRAQVSIMTFFKKVPLKLDDKEIYNSHGKEITNGANGIKEIGKNNEGMRPNGIEKEFEEESDDSTFSKETRKKKSSKLIKKAMKLKKKTKEKNNKSKNEKKTEEKKNENEYEQVEDNINGRLSKKTKRTKVKENSNKNANQDSLKNSSSNSVSQDSDDESIALDKKVRFSESIQEYSPEPLKKLSKSPKTDICNDGIKIKDSHDSERKTTEIINGNNVTEVTSVENTAKIETNNKIENVFTFMMDSRNRSIGQNLSGKEPEKSEDDNEVQNENKKKLSARKAIFQEWADIKGGQQKRLQDQETGVIIEKKLKKRARRLKKMLTQNHSPKTLNSDEKDNEEIQIKKQKAKPIIESDSECIPEEKIVEIKNSPEKLDKKGKRKRKTKNAENISIERDDSVVNENNSDAIDNEMFSRSKKLKLIIASDDSNDCNTNLENRSDQSLKNILNSPLHQTDLSNFFGVSNKNNHSKSGSKNKSKLQMKRNTIDNRISKLTLKKNEDSSSSILTLSDFSNSEIVNQSSPENNSMRIDDLNTTEIEVNENSNKSDMQNILTPRSFKKWRMRLRINLEDIDDQEIEKLVQPRAALNNNKKRTSKEITVISDFDSDSSNEPLSSLRHNLKKTEGDKLNNIQPVKLAPLFIRAKPKPKKLKLDKETIEARKRFLHSEIPDLLKKTMKKQQHKLEEAEFEIFPSVSHITIKPTNEQLNNSINFWNLPLVNLKLKNDEFDLPSLEPLTLGSFTSSTVSTNNDIQLCIPQKLSGFRSYLTQIKNDNPGYPVYKAFRFLYRKSVVISKADNQPKTNEPTNPKKRKTRKKKAKVVLEDDEIEIINNIQVAPSIDPSKQEIWTDLYKPSSSEEIFGNHTAIMQLKSWLEAWLEFSEEINMQRNKHKHDDSDSGSDFEGGDVNSRDSVKLPGNTVILHGPYGSGKTMSVYALCNELAINVLELNASSKRTGKSLLQELQEATQSHQVRKSDTNSTLASFIKKDDSRSGTSQSSDSQSSQSNKKMCLLLIEDVDIVFEQDENFINALSQLLTTSKRPVILTTADPDCLHLKKFFAQHKIISFNGLSAKVLAIWLQIICIIEGLCVNKDMLALLLEQNNGDVRHTLLQLQFWVRSGGQLNPELDRNNSMYIVNDNSESTNEDHYLFKDDSSNISWLDDENIQLQKESVVEKFVHNSCLESFGYFKNYNELYSPYLLDLGDAWWNLSNSFGTTCRNKLKKKKDSVQKNSELLNEDGVVNEIDSINLKNVSNIFEALAETDVTYKKLNIDCNSEPIEKNRGSKITNSLGLNECSEGYSLNRDLANDWCHYLFDGYLNLYKRFPEKSCSFVEEKRWRTKQYKCKEAFQEAIPFVCHLDHNSVNMDYLSTLRTMARSEVIRASNNNKRKSRFYNYLRGVGINCNDLLFKTACDVFHQES